LDKLGILVNVHTDLVTTDACTEQSNDHEVEQLLKDWVLEVQTSYARVFIGATFINFDLLIVLWCTFWSRTILPPSDITELLSVLLDEPCVLDFINFEPKSNDELSQVNWKNNDSSYEVR
jgi:hypothetical protein